MYIFRILLMVLLAGGVTVAVGLWLTPVGTAPAAEPVHRLVGLVALVAALLVGLAWRRSRR